MHTSPSPSIADTRRRGIPAAPRQNRNSAHELRAFMAARGAALLALVGTANAHPLDVQSAARAQGVRVPSTDTIARYLRAHRQVTT